MRAWKLGEGAWLPGMRHDHECRCNYCKEAKVNGWFVPKREKAVTDERKEGQCQCPNDYSDGTPICQNCLLPVAQLERKEGQPVSESDASKYARRLGFIDCPWGCGSVVHPNPSDPTAAQAIWNHVCSQRLEEIIKGRMREAQPEPRGSEALRVLRDVQPIVEFYLKREIESPANHQEFSSKAEEKLQRFHAAIAALAAATAERTPVKSLWPENLTICSRCNRDMLHNKHAVDIWGNIVCLPNVSWKEKCEADRQPAPPQPEAPEKEELTALGIAWAKEFERGWQAAIEAAAHRISGRYDNDALADEIRSLRPSPAPPQNE
jgi:hypothetical protein